MRGKKRDVLILDKTLIKYFTQLDGVVKFSDSVVFGSFVVFEDEDVSDFLVPDRKVDSC